MTNGKHIVNVSWLESLILDVFPFELELLKKSFDLNGINYPEKIELGYEELPWEKLDLINELILL
jgi:S-adenosylmethionine synthetase